MKLNVRGKNIDVTPALKEYVEKRLSKLEKFFDNELEVQVTLVVEKDTHKVEVTMPVNGMILRGEEATGDMYASIDLVIEKLERQINKYKTKIMSKRTKTGSPVEAPAAGADEDEPRIVKTKRFAIKPMPVDEAVLQMNMLGHNFFVFSNAETEEVNVVYKRKDGNYGLIEPEF
ncbi:ribosomal subunit interface protein [Thermincola ferriacetica]|uniref:Ribosome hibernation promoting factor n=1 Tax=Thermincola ferriacetica TaxID=281456 RepID=A0A0L6W419_9FIRM|nr:ribosome-associated translation inhibitor RaiA [Thermincola ferriacetica]KNZ70118.1 ribosomal subunit interface protein [Thermincola ferriacetica]